MDNRLNELLDAVWEHALPLGPECDLDERERRRRGWEDTLSADDCLLLLGWMCNPKRPPHWDVASDRWIPSLADKITFHVGRAGRRCRDHRLLSRLVDLLSDPEFGEQAFGIIFDLEESSAYLSLLNEEAVQVPINVELAEIATPHQACKLQGRLSHPDITNPAYRGGLPIVIQNILKECQRRVHCPIDAAWLRWNEGAVDKLARSISEKLAFESLPILADALEEAGCDNAEILTHFRSAEPHVQRCWIVDRLLGKE